MLPNFKPYCKAIVIKIACYWYKDSPTDEWNRIKSLEINMFAVDYFFQQGLPQQVSGKIRIFQQRMWKQWDIHM